MVARLKDVCIDANDVELIAGFWAGALEYSRHGDDDGERLDPPAGADASQLVIWVNRVPEPWTAKSRTHIDVTLHGSTPDPLVALGATILREPIDGEDWWVMADPEGTEFCAFPTR